MKLIVEVKAFLPLWNMDAVLIFSEKPEQKLILFCH